MCPIPPTVTVAICASMAFLLPVSTPPNAIVYGSGRLPLTAMLRAGGVLELASMALVPAWVLGAAGLVGP